MAQTGAKQRQRQPSEAELALNARSSRSSMLKTVLRFARRKPLGMFGLLVIVAFIFVAVFVPLIAPYGYSDQVLGDRLQGVSSTHWFGTDQLGRDEFSRVLYASRTSLYIGFGALVISSLWATALGIVSGYFGGIFDLIFQRFLDIWQAFPGLILIIAFVGALGGSPTMVMIALGVVGGSITSRILRGAALAARETEYVEAARAMGATDQRVLLRHVLPNVMYLVITTSSLRIGSFILAESSLSFLGFGVKPPEPTWGQMLSSSLGPFMSIRPELALFPGLALTLVVFSFNVFGDALRDVTDPRLRGGK